MSISLVPLIIILKYYMLAPSVTVQCQPCLSGCACGWQGLTFPWRMVEEPLRPVLQQLVLYHAAAWEGSASRGIWEEYRRALVPFLFWGNNPEL